MIASPATKNGDLADAVRSMRSLAVRSLRRMFLPQKDCFVFCIRRGPGGDVGEGISRRYTANVLLALAAESEDVAAEVLAGRTTHAVCDRLLDATESTPDFGEVALTLWACRALGHRGAEQALRRLRAMDPVRGAHRTVELAWSLTSLVAGEGPVADEALARSIADRLLTSFNPGSGLFPHWPTGVRPARGRAHVSCFADLVYPIQALSHYHLSCGHRGGGTSRALDVADQCAARMCALQGAAGQWWWHYDVRTGQVVEKYPVYSVHQDGMGPMALFALQDAGGADHHDAVARSVRWLFAPPEVREPLVDTQADLIWRKVARREPNKLSRTVQALASRVHPALRVPGGDVVFPPDKIDFESRPYHLGWLLHAWSTEHVSRFLEKTAGSAVATV